MNAESRHVDSFLRYALSPSMGPRSHERGELAASTDVVPKTFDLQWGRAHMNAERRSVVAWTEFHRAPLQWGRAHMNAERPVASTTNKPLTSLQWGRAHMNAERGLIMRTLLAVISSLQWGRAHMNAESEPNPQRTANSRKPSMGPRSHERGERSSSRSQSRTLPLQWGRAHMNAESCRT